MATLIRNGRIESDSWRLLESDDAPVGAAERVIVPLAAWQRRRDELVGRAGPVGVVLDPADDPGALRGDLSWLDLVAIRVPAFTDGRGYSSARLVRERLGWRGELRAIGDVKRDQLFYLRRCGFDSFLLAPGADAAASLAGLRDFSDGYQAAADEPLPLFRRRAA